MDSYRFWSKPVLGWILYDTANTLFSYAVITRFFNDWIIIQQKQPDWKVGVMSLGVSLALIVSLPLFGAVADATGRRKPLLAGFTLLCVSMTALLGVVGALPWTLVIAGIAIYGFNSALAHYDPLLAQVAPPEKQGRVSGAGVAAGYAGVMGAIFGLGLLVHGDNQDAFLPVAIAFGLLALPCMLWVKESGPRNAVPFSDLSRLARESGSRVVAGVRSARHAVWGRFLLARFLYVDAVATVIAFMTVYAKRVGSLTDGQIDILLALSIVFAVAGALAAGALAERIGPKRVLSGTVAGVVVILGVAAASGSAATLWVLGPAVGVALGAVNAADRVLLMRLTHETERGEVFGLYALVGKVSSGFGPLVVWGGTIWIFHEMLDTLTLAEASRAAMGMLGLTALAGWLVLRRVASDRPAATAAA